MDNIVIEEYQEKYTEEISKLIIQNLLEVNIKDYGLESVTNFAKDFEAKKLHENLSSRTKAFVALKDNVVVGTAGLAKSWYNDDGEYWILTVFVKKEHHNEGIGKKLILEIEKFAQEFGVKKLVVPASITGSEFYHKLSYQYANGKKELNKDRMYIMEKYLR